MALTAEEKLSLLYQCEERPAPIASNIAEQGIVVTPDSFANPISSSRSAADAGIQSQSLPDRTKSVPNPVQGHDIANEGLEDDGTHESDMEDDYIAACMAKACQPRSSTSNSTRSALKKGKKPHGAPSSSLSDVQRSSTETEKQTKYPYDHPVQEQDESGHLLVSKYCSLALVVVFPYKFISKTDSERVAKRFFDAGKIWNKPWDIYYIHLPLHLEANPLLLVPFQQFQDLIDQINSHYNSKLVVPANPDSGFTIPFYDDETPQPLYLGRSSGREHISEMADTIPGPINGYGEAPRGADSKVDRSFAAFKKKMEMAAEAARKKKKAVKQRRAQDRLLQQQEWCNSMKRAQRYLGLRPRHISEPRTPDKLVGWVENQALERDAVIAGDQELKKLDLDKQAPYDFDYQPIIIAIDMEWNERNHRQITELGISTLDTLDLEGIPPGKAGENWRAHIRSRHIRVAEMAYHVNRDFCPGDPAAFLFGTSEFVSIAGVQLAFDECFQWPFSIAYKLSGRSGNSDLADAENSGAEADAARPISFGVKQSADDDFLHNSTTQASPKTTGFPTDKVVSISGFNQNKGKVATSCPKDPGITVSRPFLQRGPQERKIILIGHDLANDVPSLRLIRSAVLDENKSGPNGKPIYNTILESLDTSIMHNVLIRDTAPRSLGNILLELGITGWQLHNAGNDARYTLEAFIALTITDRLNSESRRFTNDTDSNNVDKVWSAEIQRRITEKVQAVQEQVQSEAASWNAALSGKQHVNTPGFDLKDCLDQTSSAINDDPVCSTSSITQPSLTRLPIPMSSSTYDLDNLHDGGDPTGLNVPPPHDLSWDQLKPNKKKKSEAAKRHEVDEQYLQYMRAQQKKIETSGVNDVD